VAGTHLLEWTSTGIVDYGSNSTANNNMLDDGLPATMVAGGTASGNYPGQLLICSGGTLTAFNLTTNAFLPITGAPANVLMIDFLDGFFVALQSSNDFQISNPEDCTTWTGLAISQVSVFSDQLLAIIASNRLLWVFGAKRAVSYYNAGLPIFPFQVVSGGFMEVGILAQYSVARVATASGTTVMWLGGDERGARVVYAANGFVPQRVSDRGLEYWMSQQKSVADAIGFAVQENGHNFYWLYFPTANATKVLDLDLGKWHDRSSLVKGLPGAHLGRCHTYNEALGGHLVGDRNSGNVYVMSSQFLNENIGAGMNNPIIRTRIGPTVSNESSQNPISINEFQVDFELGLGPEPPLTDGFGNPRDPIAVFSYSEDFGKTWTPDRMIPCGQAGNYLTASAIDRRLGSWRSFTPRVVVSDPVAWRMVDAYVNSSQDSKPRLAKTYGALT
jgi:hypothetical protein